MVDGVKHRTFVAASADMVAQSHQTPCCTLASPWARKKQCFVLLFEPTQYRSSTSHLANRVGFAMLSLKRVLLVLEVVGGAGTCSTCTGVVFDVSARSNQRILTTEGICERDVLLVALHGLAIHLPQDL